MVYTWVGLYKLVESKLLSMVRIIAREKTRWYSPLLVVHCINHSYFHYHVPLNDRQTGTEYENLTQCELYSSLLSHQWTSSKIIAKCNYSLHITHIYQFLNSEWNELHCSLYFVTQHSFSKGNFKPQILHMHRSHILYLTQVETENETLWFILPWCGGIVDHQQLA